METNVKELAFQIAKIAFEGKTDRAGKPYLEHLVRVADKFKDDDFMYPIAILHDLIEDCPEWNEKSLRCLFSKKIVDTIVLLTKQKDQDYLDYIDKINQNSWATRVKLADLKDNMDISRLSDIRQSDIHRLQKYIVAYRTLKQ